MDVHSRIDELRRRVEKDPASIAFASLAEELRKAGEHDEAVRVCRTGLERHPTYLSARVTLGRALLALQHYGEARTEIEYVLHAAPDNLLALKCMNELEAHPSDAPPEPAKAGPHDHSASEPVHSTPELARPNLRIQTAPEPARVEPSVAIAAAEAASEPGAGAVREGGPPSQHWPVGSQSDPTPAKAAGPHDQSSAEAAPEPARALSAEPVGQTAASTHVPDLSAPPNGGPPAEHPAIGELEAWQARIQADRARRTAGSL